jgi:hypothetical protein
MKSKFLTDLHISLKPSGEGIWVLDQPLIYRSELLGRDVKVQAKFETDLASVPRIPIVYWWWGGRAHREAILHDAMYRVDFPGAISFPVANKVFLEAMESRGKPFYIRHPIYMGVCIGGKSSYHKRYIGAVL